MKCTHTDLIQKQLGGDITDAELTSLQEHLKQCPDCRQEMEEHGALGAILGDAFQSATPSKDAASQIMTRIPKIERRTKVVNTWALKWALAASLLITFSLAIGFAAGRMTTSLTATQQAPLEIKVAGLEGTVLVRHPDNSQWTELTGSSPLYMGDLLLCSAKSSLSLALKDGSSIVLEPNSIFHLDHYDGGARFVLDRGNLVADLNSPHPPFVIRTPQGEITALGTKFRVSIK